MSPRRGWLWAILGLLAGGCAAHRPVASIPPPADAAEGRAALVEAPEPARLVDGVLRLGGRYRGQRLRARILAVAAPGGRLYLEGLEGASFVVAADGERVRVLLPAERSWIDAPATAATVERLVGLGLEPAELVALLAGQGLTRARLAAGRVGGWTIDCGDARLTLDPASGRPLSGRLREVEFDYRDGGRTLGLSAPHGELSLTVRLPGRPGPAAAPAPQLFSPGVPAGFVPASLGGGGRPLLLPDGREEADLPPRTGASGPDASRAGGPR